MDTINLDLSRAWGRPGVPTYLYGRIDDDARTVLLDVHDEHGRTIMTVGLDSVAASELMVWLTSNLHRVMIPADQDPTAVSALRDAMVHHRAVYQTPHPQEWCVRCVVCNARATYYSWPMEAEPHVTTRCENHLERYHAHLPNLSELDLALLQQVHNSGGLSTTWYANTGGPSWTVRGTSNVLNRLERVHLVDADRTVRPRCWLITPMGAAVVRGIRAPSQA